MGLYWEDGSDDHVGAVSRRLSMPGESQHLLLRYLGGNYWAGSEAECEA